MAPIVLLSGDHDESDVRLPAVGIPLQQTWDYGNTSDFAPTYYLQTDAPLYYSSFTDAFIAMAYRSRRFRAPIRSRIRWHS